VVISIAIIILICVLDEVVPVILVHVFNIISVGSVQIVDCDKQGEILSASCSLRQEKSVWEATVVVVCIIIDVIECIDSTLTALLQEVDCACIQDIQAFWVSDDVLKINRVSSDDVLSIVQFDDKLIEFNKVLAIIIQLLFVVDFGSKEHSDDTNCVLV
jgi:hypothetical protein